MKEWDPIGVDGIPEAADEYDRYAGEVGEMLRQGVDAPSVAEHLRRVREEYIGLGPDDDYLQRERRIAEQLVEWYAAEMAGLA